MPFYNQLPEKTGIYQYGIIDTKQIVFSSEVRSFCEGNACRHYGTTWACPPSVGTVDECKEECLKYDSALVFNAKYNLEDSFDYEGMMAGHREFKKVCDNLFYLVKESLTDFLLLSNESCIRCSKCTYPNNPCIFPDMLFPSVEGYGILVNMLAQSANINYINGENTVTYFGLLLFNNIDI